jgi:hypothetical protein
MRRIMLVLVAAAMSTGCYHATAHTGRTPAAVKVEKRWANSWIYGLVPPQPVNAAQACPSGVAQVDTQLSLTNQLVGFLTLGIYTPMEIVVTCAQPSGLGAR